ncbi:hypothetical protein RI129_004427 [Pyrocoelia pectoralis]|uniref:Uncharacterized protein n=1 Tax=Pyrocoelia pectoralis TaxID=417401 RepID=A0AAN7VIX5_9COLE
MAKKGNRLVGKVWGVGERVFGKDMEKKRWIFDKLVKSVMVYGAEIWGWKEWEKMEKIQEKYWRWTLGLDRETPGYIVEEEIKFEKIRVQTGKRAVKYEEEVRKRNEIVMVNECMREIRKERIRYGQEERRLFYERVGYAREEIERRREEGRDTVEELVARDKDVQGRERRERIAEGRYNEGYMEIMVEGKADYIVSGMELKEKRMVARFRCGNEENESRYWWEDEKRIYRMCGEGRENIWHMMREKVILGVKGEGVEWMKGVLESRERVERRGQV